MAVMVVTGSMEDTAVLVVALVAMVALVALVAIPVAAVVHGVGVVLAVAVVHTMAELIKQTYLEQILIMEL